VAETATEPLLVPLQKHLLGGCTRRTVIGRWWRIVSPFSLRQALRCRARDAALMGQKDSDDVIRSVAAAACIRLCSL